ncbi:hypothetical protein BS47DRAFT_1286212, partial [Hydnum rufescens UP504]
LPTLVMPFLQWCQQTCYGRLESPPAVAQDCVCGETARRVAVTAVYLDRLEEYTLSYCDCRPLGLTLMGLGLFPSSPTRPSVAFALNHLLFVTKLFVNISPNITAWCSTVFDNLVEKGYSPSANVSSCFDTSVNF